MKHFKLFSVTVSKQSLRTFLRTSKGGYEISRWLFYEAYLKHKHSTLLILTSSGLAVFFQISVFLVALKFIRSFGEAGDISIGGFNVTRFTGNNVLASVTCYIIFALSASALLHYYSRIHSTTLAQGFKRKCLGWILDSFSVYPFFGYPKLDWLNNDKVVSRLFEIDIQTCSRAIRSMYLLLLPSTFVCVSAVALIVLNPRISLYVGFFSLIALCSHLLISHQGVRNSIHHEKIKYKQRALRKSMVSSLISGSDANTFTEVERNFSRCHEDDLRYLKKNEEAIERTQLFTRFLSGILLTFVIVYMANNIGDESFDFIGIILYVILLRYCMAYFLTGISIASRLSSAIPSVRRVMQLKNILTVAEIPTPETKEYATLNYVNLSGKICEYTLSTQQPILILANTPFDRFTAGRLMRSVQGTRGCSFVSGGRKIQGVASTALFFPTLQDDLSMSVMLNKQIWLHGIYIWCDIMDVTQLPPEAMHIFLTITMKDGQLIGGKYSEIHSLLPDSTHSSNDHIKPLETSSL